MDQLRQSGIRLWMDWRAVNFDWNQAKADERHGARKTNSRHEAPAHAPELNLTLRQGE